MRNEKWRIENGEWRIENGEWNNFCDKREL